MAYQGLLFSEPSIAETGVWCTLSEGIDPAQWAMVCRYIGNLSPQKFEQIKSIFVPNTDCLNRDCRYNPEPFVDIPLISIGPSGLGGNYQSEVTIE
jgi:hypothetical protein